MPITKVDPKPIFASNAPTQDKPAQFLNYERGWDESRKKDGRPSIKQSNFLQEQTDKKILWLHEAGGALPYDPTIDYQDGAIVLKDGELQQKIGVNWLSLKPSKNTVLSVKVVSDLYNLEKWDGRLVAVSNEFKGLYQCKDGDWWYVSDEGSGTLSAWSIIPANKLQYLNDFNLSASNIGVVEVKLQALLDYASSKGFSVKVPSGIWFLSKTVYVPPLIRFYTDESAMFHAVSTFSETAMFSCDLTGQPRYYMDGFSINGEITKDMVGLHVGGCRGSVFEKLTITGCKSAGVLVYPTHPGSGDVENITLRHIWTMTSGGVILQTNSNIDRGNITDGQIYDCQLTTGTDTADYGVPLTFRASTGRAIFGMRCQRIFTMCTENNHVRVIPNGGDIYANTWTDFTGESRVIGSDDPNAKFNHRCLEVFEGNFFDNTVESFYRTGMQGTGLYLGQGSINNIFKGLVFKSVDLLGFNNTYIYLDNGANNNTFDNVSFVDDLYADAGGTRLTPIRNIMFGFGGKIQDYGINNSLNTNIVKQLYPSLLKRSYFMSVTGTQLTNFPMPSCSFETTGNGVLVTIPAGSDTLYLDIPYNTQGAMKMVSVFLKYVCYARNGLNISVFCGGAWRNITDFTQDKTNYMQFYSDFDPSNQKIILSFGGVRTADSKLEIQDIAIGKGELVPYVYNFNKLYIES